MTLTPKTARGRFVRHYVEMVIAMFIGMGVFWPVWLGLFSLIGQPQLADRTDVDALTMALNMSLGMAAWMRFRGHRWAPILEMSAAMVAPFVVLLVPFWLGGIDRDALMTAAHAAMFVTMLIAMLWRRDEYTADHSAHGAHGEHSEHVVHDVGDAAKPA
jgi:flagellar biosynthetic protein FliP